MRQSVVVVGSCLIATTTTWHLRHSDCPHWFVTAGWALAAVASAAVATTDYLLQAGSGLPVWLQAVNWLAAGSSVVLVVAARTQQRSVHASSGRAVLPLLAVVHAIAPLYTLLSVSYEPCFVAAVIGALMVLMDGTGGQLGTPSSRLLHFLVFFQVRQTFLVALPELVVVAIAVVMMGMGVVVTDPGVRGL